MGVVKGYSDVQIKVRHGVYYPMCTLSLVYLLTDAQRQAAIVGSPRGPIWPKLQG